MLYFKVGKIYLLMREKRGKSIEQRLEDLTKNEVNLIDLSSILNDLKYLMVFNILRLMRITISGV